MKLLLIEDNADDAMLIAAGVEAFCDTILCSSASSAIQKLTTLHPGDIPDLILISLDFPVSAIGGILSWARAQAAPGPVPVYLLASSVPPWKLTVARRMQPDGIWDKDALISTPSELRACVSEARSASRHAHTAHAAHC